MISEHRNRMTLYIKNMVCDRCKTAVSQELRKLQIVFQKIELGEVLMYEIPPDDQLNAFKKAIKELGFELIDDKNSRVIEKIKSEIIKKIHDKGHKSKTNISTFLVEKIGKDYSSLSSLFSEVEGTTIEQYVIRQKIERVKELLVYDELSLSQIAIQLHYSSVQHLSKQFKKVTGLTPSHFKNLRPHIRKPLDKV